MERVWKAPEPSRMTKGKIRAKGIQQQIPVKRKMSFKLSNKSLWSLKLAMPGFIPRQQGEHSSLKVSPWQLLPPGIGMY